MFHWKHHHLLVGIAPAGEHALVRCFHWKQGLKPILPDQLGDEPVWSDESHEPPPGSVASPLPPFQNSWTPPMPDVHPDVPPRPLRSRCIGAVAGALAKRTEGAHVPGHVFDSNRPGLASHERGRGEGRMYLKPLGPSGGDPSSKDDMSCIVLTARGAVWAEHVVGLGFNNDAELMLTTKDGFHYGVGVRHAGPEQPMLAAILLSIIEEQARSSVRERIVLVLRIVDDFRVMVDHREPAVWRQTRRTTVTLAADLLQPPPPIPAPDLDPPE